MVCKNCPTDEDKTYRVCKIAWFFLSAGHCLRSLNAFDTHGDFHRTGQMKNPADIGRQA